MTRIFRIEDVLKSIDEISEAARSLKNGGLVVFPTETVYGVGALMTLEKSVIALYEAKRRPRSLPLALHLARRDLIPRYAKRTPLAQRLIDAFMPGPIMVILEKLPLVPDIITGGSATVGIRVPSHPVAMALLELLDDPVAATSANISGSPAGATIDHILEDLAGKVQVALESAEPLLGIESTIIDMTRREPVILRRGFISPDEIASVLGTAPLMTESPGRKLFPAGTTCIFVEGDREGIAGEMEKIIDESPGVSIGILASTELAPHLPRVSFTGVLGSADNPQEIARNFLVRMRQIIDAGVGLILIEGIRGEGPAHAVMERLRAGADEIRRSGAPKS